MSPEPPPEPPNRLIGAIDAGRGGRPLASACRLTALAHAGGTSPLTSG